MLDIHSNFFLSWKETLIEKNGCKLST